MRVLVLRPKPAAARTATKLAGRGHDAVLLPLSRAEHDVAAVRAALAEPHAAIAITSAEVTRLLAKTGEDLLPHLSTHVFTVGEASADAARAAGFRSVQAAGGTGEALAAGIVAHYSAAGVPADPILYLAGNPRAPDFEQRLREAAMPVRTVESYRMVTLTPAQAEVEAALNAPMPDAVLLYSRESARAFFRLAPLVETPDLFTTLRVLCLSPNVAAIVPDDFAERTETAAAPDEESLLALL